MTLACELLARDLPKRRRCRRFWCWSGVELFRQAAQNGKHLAFVGSLQSGQNTVANQTLSKQPEGTVANTIERGTGHSGISRWIDDRQLSPEIALSRIGRNDINGNVDFTASPTRLRKLIDDITTNAPNALLVLATIIPIESDGSSLISTAYIRSMRVTSTEVGGG